MPTTQTTQRIFGSPLAAPPVELSPAVSAVRRAAEDPGRTAVVDGATGERLSRAELAERSAALAAGLRARGIRRGDPVAVAMPNTGAWPVVAVGVWRAGAALVPLNPFWTAHETDLTLSCIEPRLTITADSYEALLEDAGEDPLAEPRLDRGELALVLFSSGTGGIRKGVRLTHGNLAAAAGQFARSLRIGRDSVCLACAPFFHSMGIGPCLCTPLGVGGRIVTTPVPETHRVLELIAEHGVTHAVVAPPMFEEIATVPRVERRDTARLELLATGGAHLPAGVEERASERLGCVARGGYGMTEAFMVSGPLGRPNDPSTVGWLAEGCEARLVDPDSGRDADPGEPGELWLRGPQVMEGYHDEPEASAATITPDGWLRTGDLVAIRPDGQLVIKDRLKDLIKVGGRSVVPAELELLLRTHPAVRDAAVVGRPDAEHGEAPVASVVLDGPASAEELKAFVADRVSAHWELREVHLVDELPRLPSGKLVRRALRD